MSIEWIEALAVIGAITGVTSMIMQMFRETQR